MSWTGCVRAGRRSRSRDGSGRKQMLTGSLMQSNDAGLMLAT